MRPDLLNKCIKLGGILLIIKDSLTNHQRQSDFWNAFLEWLINWLKPSDNTFLWGLYIISEVNFKRRIPKIILSINTFRSQWFSSVIISGLFHISLDVWILESLFYTFFFVPTVYTQIVGIKESPVKMSYIGYYLKNSIL